MRVIVSTPSRLHFGLLRFEQPGGLSYGGLGMMIAEPRWVVELEAANAWSVAGPSCERALEFARLVLGSLQGAANPRALRVVVRRGVPEHRGLGGGTQLGLAVAAGVRSLVGFEIGTAEELAALSQRGGRSAVGSHGFVQGGLIWDAGRAAGEALGRLADRAALPGDWRVVLITPRDAAGLSGSSEVAAFRQLPPVPHDVTQQLVHLAEEEIIPAAEEARLAAFGDALYEYGRIAGNCFAAVQGGPYASPRIAACVSTIRRLGVLGVGQSSWGPTVFAMVADQHEAEWLVARIGETASAAELDIAIAAADNRGAVIDVVP